jgi:hypothetical protein
MGGRAALGDYDGDGDDDLFVVSAGAALTALEADRAASTLYENLGDGMFRQAPDGPTMRIVGMG